MHLAGQRAEDAVDQIVIKDCIPSGQLELEALRDGLQAIAAWWASRRKAKAGG